MMTLDSLRKKLNEMNVKKSGYSLNEGLKHDAFIIEENYGKWKYFYFDEKGNYEDEHMFLTEDEACQYLLSKILLELKYPPKQFPM